MNIKQCFCKCATTLAVVVTLGQTMISPIQVFANELDQSEVSTVQIEKEETTTSESQTELVQEHDEKVQLKLPTSELPDVKNEVDPAEVKNLMDRFLDSQPRTRTGYTNDGNILTFSLGGNPFLRDIGNSHGKLTKYYSDTMYISTPYIEISGIENGAVWCVKPDAPFPISVEYAMKIYGDKGVYNILYYAVQRGFDQPGDGYIDTFVALNGYLGHSYQGVDLNVPVFLADPNVAFLRQKAIDQDAPNGHFDIENKVQTADFDTTKKIQSTKWYTPTFDGSNVTYDIPTNEFDKAVTIELSDGTSFTGQSGTKTIAANVKFRLTAPVNYTKKIKFTVNTNQKKQTALMFEPIAENVQSVVKPGVVGDPTTVPDVQATFFARQGKFKLKKTSEISNLPMGAVGFKVTMSTGEVLELETNEKGETPISKDYDFGTTGKVTEVKTPAGYVQLENPISFTIAAGETIEVGITNKVQKGKVKAQKFEETYEAQETWDAGKPIYTRNPAANREFDIVRENDHTLPDLKTVVGKAGEVVDHVKTDENGNFESNVELFIGEQNKYKLVETNTPENYRDPSDVQTEFSIPYGNNTEKLVLFDQGEIDNELKTANITFNKKNALNLDGLNIAGADFLVEGITNDVKFMFTTENEAALLKLLADKGTATYKFTEVKRPNGFEQVPGTTDTRIVTVTDGQDLTIDWENMPKIEEPEMGTQAYANNGGKDFDRTIDNDFYDKIKYENFDGNKYLVTKVVGVKTGKVYAEFEGELVIDQATGEKVVKTTIPANTIGEEDVRFIETAYNDKTKKEVYVNHDDPNDKEQTLYYKAKETPVTPKTPTTPTKTGTLPTTGEMIQSTLLMIGLMVVAVAGFLFQKKYELD